MKSNAPNSRSDALTSIDKSYIFTSSWFGMGLSNEMLGLEATRMMIK